MKLMPLDTNGPSVQIATGNQEAVKQSLATLDTTLIANGVYTVTLTTADEDGNVGLTQRTVTIGGGLKLGNFTLGLWVTQKNKGVRNRFGAFLRRSSETTVPDT